MVTGCAHCGRFLSFQRKEALNPDLIAGHWYGCPGCGRDVCDDCGRASGQRCLGCGEGLEPDQQFPIPLRAHDDEWRGFVAYVVEQQDFFGSEHQLVACVTESSFADIDAALDEYMRDLFRHWVCSWDIARRLGTTDGFHLGGHERRWTPEWEQRLALAAEKYRARADEAARDALEQDEILFGWTLMAPALPLPLEDVFALALHPDDRLADQARDVLCAAVLSNEVPLPGVVEGGVRLFRSAQVPRLRRALSAIAALPNGRPSIHIASETRDKIEQRVCMALAEREPHEREALLQEDLARPDASPRDVTASLVVTLGLAREVLPWLLTDLEARRWRKDTLLFLADMGTAAASARDAVREFLERTNDSIVMCRGLRALHGMGMPFAELFALARSWLQGKPIDNVGTLLGLLLSLWEEHDEGARLPLREACLQWAQAVRTPEERLRLIESLHGMERSRRDTFFPGLPEPVELFLSLLEDARDHHPLALCDSPLLKLHHESPRLRAWLMAFVEAEPDDLLSKRFLRSEEPERETTVEELCEAVSQRGELLVHRIAAAEELGRVARGTNAPARDVLVERFLDPREWRDLRLAAARAFWSAGGRVLPAARLAPVLEDSSATLRCWALLLADHVEEERLAALRHDALPLVRRVAQARGARG